MYTKFTGRRHLEESLEITGHNFDFYSVLMAAMRMADSDNAAALKDAFPDVWEDLVRRRNAPGGCLTIREMVEMSPKTSVKALESVFRSTLSPGTQIAKTPHHLQINHPETQFGFVTSTSENYAFCRFWNRGAPLGFDDLRTKANSEAVSIHDLMLYNHTSKEVVIAALAEIMYLEGQP